MMYQLQLEMTGNGPRMSIANRMKAPSTGIWSNGASSVCPGIFFIAQSIYDLHQCSTSLNIPYKLKRERSFSFILKTLKFSAVVSSIN